MDPYEEYMRSLRPDLYQQGPNSTDQVKGVGQGAAQGASMGSALGPWGAAAGAVIGGGASLYASNKAMDAARDENRRARQREAMNDYFAQQDRTERRRRQGVAEGYEAANYSGDFMGNLFDLYKSYNGGYFNLHG